MRSSVARCVAASLALCAGSAAASAQIYPSQQFRCAPSWSNASVFSDLDHDGHSDIVSAHGNFDRATVTFGRGDAAFEAPLTIGHGETMYGVATADLDHDGHPDVVLLNGLPEIEIWLGDGARGFTLHARMPTIYQPSAVAIADLDLDTHADLVVTNVYLGLVTVWLGDGLGNFASPTRFSVGASQPTSVVAADLDLDGDIDVATANAGSISVVLGDGSGELSSTPVTYNGPNRPLGLRVARMNADAAPDLVSANDNAGFVYVLASNGAGGFSVATSDLGAPLESFDVADVNGDGNEDVVAVGGWYKGLVTALGDGLGGLAVMRPTRTMASGHVVLGDVNLDSRADAVICDGHATVHLGLGNGRFEGLSVYDGASGGTDVALALGDLDHDGALDVVTANRFGNRVDVRLNDGHGQFDVVWGTGLGSSVKPMDVELCDLDEDGDLDLVTANEGNESVAVLLGTGSAAFGTPAFSTVGIDPFDVELADVNGDQHLDVVTANGGSIDVTVRLGDGTGALGAPTSFSAGFGPPSGLVIGNFTADNALDIVVANRAYHATVSLLAGNGAGGFAAPVSFVVSAFDGGYPRAIAAADLDLDGHLDVVTSNEVRDELAVLPGVAGGGFGTPRPYEVRAGRPIAVAIADVDMDGVLDLIGSAYAVGPSVRLGSGNGSFSHETNFGLPLGDPHALAIADVDGDSKPDLVSAASGGAYVYVLSQRGAAPNCPCAAESYCYGAANSATTLGARIANSGSLSIAQNTFALRVSGVVPNATSLFLFGTQRQMTPFGAGYRCVGGAAFRLGPPLAATSSGVVARSLDFTSPPLGSGASQVGPGVPWHFQLWYRDPVKLGSNFSDALQATFCP